MDLFTPITEHGKLHPNFLNALEVDRQGERNVVQSWAEGFPDRDNKFVHEFQTTFNSSFWELYLHGLLRSYDFELDWARASPDFNVRAHQSEFIVEAVTANAASGARPEWDKPVFDVNDLPLKEFWPLNHVAMVRLSNALSGKVRKYGQSYSRLRHVAGKPFVIAVAPFEQPLFQHQYDRPIRALLYNDYVDEDAFIASPESFPSGHPPSVALNSIEKSNGATIDLGIFLDEGWAEVSAVLYSCAATWGKTVAMSSSFREGVIATLRMERTDLRGMLPEWVSPQKSSLMGCRSITIPSLSIRFHWTSSDAME